MKKIPIMFLQVVIVLVGVVVLALLIRLPLTEGRAAKLDLFSIYADPFILYVYAASIAFFIALYKAFKLLRYISQNKTFSSEAVAALKGMKYCAIILSVLIVLAGIYIRVFHHKEDDPAGFIALCTAATFIAMIAAAAAAVFESILRGAIAIIAGNTSH